MPRVLVESYCDAGLNLFNEKDEISVSCQGCGSWYFLALIATELGTGPLIAEHPFGLSK